MNYAEIKITPMEIQEKLESGELVLDSYLQRKPGQWNELSKSLLIHSMLKGYIIPEIYFTKCISKDENGKITSQLEVTDGLQRITIILGYMDGEFALDERTPNVLLRKKTEIVLAGKYYVDLPNEAQEDIKRYMLHGYSLENFTDEEIEENFYRLNNGVALTKNQQSKAKMGRVVAEMITEILSKPFFSDRCTFSPEQQRRSADQLTLIQGMALLDYVAGDYQLKTISEKDMFDYCTGLRDNYPTEKVNLIKDITEYLGSAFAQKNKNLRKINIPIIMVTAKKGIEMGIPVESFGEWAETFFKGRKPGDAYGNACSAGSIKLNNTLARINIMNESFMNYCKANNLGTSGTSTDSASESSVKVEVIESTVIPENITEETTQN